MSLCPTDAELTDLLEASFNFDSTAIEAHLSRCARCQARLDTWVRLPKSFVAALQSSPQMAFQHEQACGQLVDRMAEFAVHFSDWTSPGSGPQAAGRSFPQPLGQYVLVGLIAEGGMGTIFRAVDPDGGWVAVKLMRPGSVTPKTVARFKQEMRVVAELQHPGIVAALAEGECEGVPYLVMEFIDGIDLSHLSHDCGRLDVSDACELVRQAAEGLQYSHQRGVIHRDIKPSNLMLSRQSDGSCRLKILDLGLVRLIESRPDEELTVTGQIMGTLDYMSPEQALNSRSADARADVYSLGATLWKLLTGRVLGTLHPTAVLKSLQSPDSTRPPMDAEATSALLRASTLPRPLIELVGRMTAWEPDARLSTANQVAESLIPWCAGHRVHRLLESVTRYERGELTKCDNPPGKSTAPPLPVVHHEDSITAPPLPGASTALKPAVGPDTGGRKSRRRLLGMLACLGAGVLPFASLWQGQERPSPTSTEQATSRATAEPQVELEVNDPQLKVWLTGLRMNIALTAGRRTTVPPGEYRVSIAANNEEYASDSFVISATTALPANSKPGAPTSTVTGIRVTRDTRSLEIALGSQLLGKFPSGDQDRHVAGWICRQPGGYVLMTTQDGERQSWHSVQDPQIPDEYIRLSSVGFEPAANSPGIASLDTLALAADVSQLRLRGIPLGDSGWTRISRFRSLKSLRTLSLEDTGLTDAAAATFKAFPNLYSLDLSKQSGMSDAALEVLGRHPNVHSLSLQGSSVTGWGLAALRPLALHQLRLTGCNLRQAEFSNISRLETLAELILNDTPVADSWLPALQTMQALHSIELRKTLVTNEGLKLLGKMGSLRNLDLSDLPINGVGLEHLRGLKFVSLTLAATDVRDADLEWIAPDDINRLDLMGTAVTDAAIDTLAKFSKLTDVRLGFTQISAAGRDRLKKLLPNCNVR